MDEPGRSRSSSCCSIRSSIRSIRSRRRSTPRQPEVIRSTSEREVLDAGPALGLELALKALEAADRLRGEPAHLGEVAGDGQHLGAQGVVQRLRDALGQRRLELRRGLGEGLELLAGPLERRLQGRLVRRSLASACSRRRARSIASSSTRRTVPLAAG